MRSTYLTITRHRFGAFERTIDTDTRKPRSDLFRSFPTRICQLLHHRDHFRRIRVEIESNNMYRARCPTTGQFHPRDEAHIVCFATVSHREIP